MFHASQHLLLEVNETTRFRRKKLNMRNKLDTFPDQIALQPRECLERDTSQDTLPCC